MADVTYGTTNSSGISGLLDDANDENGFSTPLLTFAAAMTFLIMIVGIFGNFLTIAALVKCPKVRNVAAAFIISLCLADLIFCALVLPFSGLRFIQGTWTFGEMLCRLIPFIQYGNIGVSLLCIAMITINRYVMITHHSSYSRIYKNHWIAVMIAFCWIFSYGMQLPTLLGAWGRFGYDPRLQTCSIMNDSHGHSSKTTLFITAFVIPCLVIIACYTKIFWVVHKSEQRMKEHANKQNSIPNNLRPMPSSLPPSDGGVTAEHNSRISCNIPSDASSFSTDIKNYEASQQHLKQQPTRVKDQREVRAKRNEWRITKMVLAIFLSFVICYLPITIVKVADKDVEHPSFHIFSYIMLYLSACINPIIYVIMNKQYRKAYKTVIMCDPTRLLSHFGKTNGSSTAAEKWKDTGLSNNHSRTLVSQMSAVGSASVAASPENTNTDPQNAILQQRVRPQSMIAFEMTPPPPPAVTNTFARSPILMSAPLSRTPTTVMTREPQQHRQNNSQDRLNNFRVTLMSGTAGPSHRTTLVGGDIILEEEETTAALTTPVQTPAMSTNSQSLSPTSTFHKDTSEDLPKKNPFYGQNLNEIQAKDANQASSAADRKVNAKLKI